MSGRLAKGARWWGAGEAGSAMTEAALTAPILVMTILWSMYFWEMQQAKLKGAEAARFMAFERAAGRTPAQINPEARERFKDLESTTPTGELAAGYRNSLEIVKMEVKDVAAPLSGTSLDSSQASQAGGIASYLGTAMQAVGGTVDKVVGVFGFKTDQGAAQSTVELKMTNNLVPRRVAFLDTAGGQDGTDRPVLDLTFKDQYSMYFDTWRAWQANDAPNNTYSVVQSRTRERVRRVAYLGLTDAGGGVVNTIGEFLDALGLDFPLYDGYIDDATIIKKVRVYDGGDWLSSPNGNGRYGTSSDGWRPTRTVDGDALQGLWWVNDFCYCHGQNCRGSCWTGGGERESNFTDILYKRGVRTAGDERDNFPMRSFNCRGKFFEGMTKNGDLELEVARGGGTKGRQHYRVDNRSCIDGDL